MARTPEPRSPRRLPATLLALNALLCAAVYWAATADFAVLAAATENLPPPSPVQAESRPVVVPTPIQAAQLSETLARPLFRPDRRPFVQAAPVEVADTKPEVPVENTPPLPAPAVKLLGTMRLPGGAARALVRIGGEGRGVWVSVGADLEGWQIVDVGSNAIELENGGRRHVIDIDSSRSAAPAAR